jgi:hypothetical protein
MAFKKSIEESMEEEYEEPKEEKTCLPKSQIEEPEQLDHSMQPCEPIESVIVPKLENVQLGLKLLYKKQKDLKLQVTLSEKTRSPKDSPIMQHG